MLKLALQIVLMAFPWVLRRPLLNRLFGYRISVSARVGLSLINCRTCEIHDNVRIGHFNSFRNLDKLVLEDNVIIGNFNWFSCTPLGHPVHYADQPARETVLWVRREASFSSRHHVDCTDRVEVGAFTTIAGIGTQILTHGIDVRRGRQLSGPVTIGAYCFVGSRALFLKNTSLADYSVLAAGAVVAKPLVEPNSLFGGVPAVRISDLPADAPYFTRSSGFTP